MADGRHLEKSKNDHFRNDLTDQHETWQGDAN